jgi:NAD(P)-dependent dehydrogenase (short-subunit alcohol dehydrogenase family)
VNWGAFLVGAARSWEIGRSIAHALAKNGASVVVNDIGRTEEGGSTAESVASEIEAASAYLCWLVWRFGFAFGFSCLFAETTGHRSYLLIRSQ